MRWVILVLTLHLIFALYDAVGEGVNEARDDETNMTQDNVVEVEGDGHKINVEDVVVSINDNDNDDGEVKKQGQSRRQGHR